MVKAYQLLNEYRNYTSDTSVPPYGGMAFAQGSKNTDANKEWMAKQKCFKCGKKVHFAHNCPNKNDNTSSKKEVEEPTNKEDTKTTTNTVSKKDKKAVQLAYQHEYDEGAEEAGEQNCSFDSNFGLWNYPDSLKKELQDYLLLYNQAIASIVLNKKLLLSIWQSNESTIMHGIGGSIKTNWKGYMKGYGMVWYSLQVNANILLLKDVNSKFKMTYTSDNGSVFTIHSLTGLQASSEWTNMVCTWWHVTSKQDNQQNTNPRQPSNQSQAQAPDV